jgi:diguanylate cyclase (GGDEF)-like protein
MKLMVFTADMDGLKTINDRFGHGCGDIALKEVAYALSKAADDDEICIRLGGDEYMAIGMDYDEAKMSKFINDFVDELNSFNASGQYEFGVYVSYGYNLILPGEETTIESCLSLADSLMYHHKYNKASKNIKANLYHNR